VRPIKAKGKAKLESYRVVVKYLDDHDMVRMLARLKEDGVTGDHVINNVALGDFFGAEGLWC
jgi:hypothetical protein